MKILGLFGNFHRGTHDASCVLIDNGEIISYVEEERFNRIKHSVGLMPERALSFTLKNYKLDLEKTIIAFPQVTWQDFPRRAEQFFYYKYGKQPKKVIYFSHHLSHAASSYYSSGFKSSAIMTADFSGDSVSGGFYRGSSSEVAKIKEIPSNNSLGTFYSALTQFLGFERNLDEYKVMGLAGFGRPTINLDSLVSVSDWTYFVNKKYINPDVYISFPAFFSNQQPLFNKNLEKLLGKHRLRGTEITRRHQDIAASAQKKLEEVVLKLIEKLIRKTKEENLCVAGGVFLNCTLNGAILKSGLVKNLYIPPVSGDNGVALGAAYLGAIKYKDQAKQMKHAYLGTSYTDREIEYTLKRSKQKYKKVAAIEKEIAKRLSKGEIIGHFNGRMEVGARALGNRSILADARDPKMKNKINKLVKFREEFRPFAPAVLANDAKEYFADVSSSPYMTVSFKVRENARKVIPATTHIDGSARVQTVEKETNPRFWNIINEFKKVTSVSVVLNTSLNRNFEPIVESPDQAMSVFAATGMDALVLGNFLLTKN